MTGDPIRFGLFAPDKTCSENHASIRINLDCCWEKRKLHREILGSKGACITSVFTFNNDDI